MINGIKDIEFEIDHLRKFVLLSVERDGVCYQAQFGLDAPIGETVSAFALQAKKVFDINAKSPASDLESRLAVVEAKIKALGSEIDFYKTRLKEVRSLLNV